MNRCRRCGCPRDVHTHFNRRTYCGRCGSEKCPRFRRPFRAMLWRSK